jgi:hypothetical protein
LHDQFKITPDQEPQRQAAAKVMRRNVHSQLKRAVVFCPPVAMQ